MVPQYNSGQLMYFEHIVRYLFASQFVKTKQVLDVACGSGYGASILLHYGAKKVVGIDHSKDTINHAKKYYQEPGIAFLKAEAHSLPFDDGFFDIVTTFETIEHLKSQEKFLIEIKRVLKKEGLLILSTPNGLVYKKGNPFHKKEFSPKELSKLLSKHFLKISMFYQNNFFANTILSPTALEKGFFDIRNIKGETQINAKNLKLFNLSSKKSLYLNVLASDKVLPRVQDLVTLFSPGLPDRASEEMGNLSRNLKEKTRQLREIRSSRGWKIISFLHSIRIKLPFLKNL
ncbi:MAG: Glycosyltransferase, group 2 family protein [Candidatus Woesebacteria bacterium GW2011_GWB1_38_5b]|uniref:Glycosyltransferase, group 2 family protein n=1 Tax=Candidatus Woesebacteria bacterium GW2011_GWB1_38_5b TaxID=1618569 RepID=A0A0G0K3I2_9BACT|nr:MAG: Glycosyltransferase, group 2 family protein [Candidatus Woesebacteria bacterium GW2011_GWB1_38_5b]